MSKPINPGDPAPDLLFRLPEATELSALVTSGALRADSEQQQQQQQQQQQALTRRRYINVETQLPEEEVVSKISGEVKQLNKLAKRA